MLTEDEKVSKPGSGGITHTTFTFQEQKVRKQFDKAKIDGDSLEANGGFVYLNGIFRVYKGNSPISGYKKTLSGIRDAAQWRNPNDFKDHFNIQIKYEPVEELQPVYLTIMKYSSKGFTFVSRDKIGEVMERSNFRTATSMIPGTIEGNKGTLYLYRTHWAKWTDEERQHGNGAYRKIRNVVKTTENPKADWEAYKESLKGLRARKINVGYGGIEIVCVYKNFSESSPPGKEDAVEGELEEPLAAAVIQSDFRGDERFDSQEGIPTSESQYVQVKTKEYLAQYKFQNYAGVKRYQQRIPGGVDGLGNPKPDTFRTVERRYSYWKIVDLSVYRLSGADVENGSLPGGAAHLATGHSYKAPSVFYQVPSSNMIEPANKKTSIGQIRVRNDEIIFNGQTIMDGSWTETATEPPEPIPAAEETDENVLYCPGLVIGRDKANGEYESEGRVVYTRVCHYGGEGEGDRLEYDIEDINDVLVHTPVVCDGRVEDVRRFNQLLQPNQSIAGIVLDCPFRVELPTEGYHTERKGYAYRDYGKYTERREVRFPFDVYREKSYFRANTWIGLSQEETEFYLPIWVDEGEYTVEFRSRSLNCDANDGLDWQEDLANTDYENYVAADTADVEVSGRIYGLSLYDISDYPAWERVFRKPNSLALTGFSYVVGNRDQNGALQDREERFTLAMVNGSHPENGSLGIQKTGYVSRFFLTTVGNLYGEKDYIYIKPTFYSIGRDGKQKEVDLYYTETIGGERQALVRAGSSLDFANHKAIEAKDPYTGILREELAEKARLEGKDLEEVERATPVVYTFSNILVPSQLRAYQGSNHTPTGQAPSGVDKDKVAKSMQKWYFEYYLPSDVHICEKGFDVASYAAARGGLDFRESFWLTEGELLVNFEIQSIANGERRLSYANQANEARGYCNMWKREGYAYRKTGSVNGEGDSHKKEYFFKDGDALLYFLGRSAAVDYLSGGTH